MRLPTTTITVLLLANLCANCQNLHRPPGAVYIGQGAYSLNYTDVFSFTVNQASLAQLDNAGMAVAGEKKFMLSELNNYIAAFTLPTRSGNFGLKVGYAGFSDYNESQLGLAYARHLGEKLDIGVQFNYNGIRIAGYGTAAAVSFESGTIVHLTEKLHAGIHMNNPVGGKFGKDRPEKLSSVYSIGFGYEASGKFFFSTEIVKEEDQPINVNAGMQYKFLVKVMARAGISTAVSTAWMGVCLYWKSFRVDLTTSYHQQLGITPGLLLFFNFKSNAN